MSNLKIIMQKNNNIWKCEINENKINYTWGQVDGLMQNLNVEIQSGKNIGKTNETTKEEQAIVEAKAKINNKIKEGYSIIENTFDVKLKKQRQCPQPMLAKEFQERLRFLNKSDEYFYQPKLDGIRCIANIKTGKLYSRKGEEITTMGHISSEIIANSHLFSGEWLDGELYIHGVGFQTLMSVIRSNVNQHQDSGTIEYHVYDYIDEKLSFKDRISNLRKSFDGDSFSKLKLVKTKEVLFNELDAIHDEEATNGYEGIMVRKASSVYETKRSSNLLKLKKFIQNEYEISGFSREKHNNTLAALILKTDKGAIFEATPKMSDADKLYLWNNRETILINKMMATVKFQEYTDDMIPRFPVCIGIRDQSDMGE